METRKDSKNASDRREMGGMCQWCGSQITSKQPWRQKFCGYECANKGKAQPRKKPLGLVNCSICLRRVGLSIKTIPQLLPVTEGWLSVAWRKAGFDSTGTPTWKEATRIARSKDQARERKAERERNKPFLDAMAAIERLRKKAEPRKPRRMLVGQTFGRLTVISYAGRKARKISKTARPLHMWNCECECGRQKQAATAALTKGHVISCGCITRERMRRRQRSDDPKMQEHRRIAAKLRQHMKDTIDRMKAKGGGKSGKTCDILGCSIAMLREHLEAQFAPGMTWANHGKKWEIDHIMPLARFDLTNDGHARMAARYTNLQPLWKEQNAAKADKIIDHQAILL